MPDIYDFERTLQTLTRVGLFRHYHNAPHIEKQHIHISLNGLEERSSEKYYKVCYGGEAAIASKFYANDLKDVLPMIRTCVSRNLEKIEKWLSDSDNVESLETWTEFGSAVGFCVVYDLYWEKFPNSIVVVVLEKVPQSLMDEGVLFWVKTAYPHPNAEIEDDIYRKIDLMDGNEEGDE